MQPDSSSRSPELMNSCKMSSAAGARDDDWRKASFDQRAIGLFPRRQLEGLAELPGAGITAGPGRRRGHLEEHPAWLAKINRPEILTVHHGGDVDAAVDELLAQPELLVGGADRECHMVHSAKAIHGT